MQLVSSEAGIYTLAVLIQSSCSYHSGYPLSAENIFQRNQSLGLERLPCKVIFGVRFEGGGPVN